VYEDPAQNGPLKHTASWEYHIRIDQAEAYRNAQKKLLSFSDDIKEIIPEETLKNTKWHFALLKGGPENVIVALSERYKPSFILMAPKDKSEKKGMFVGSVTTKVIEHTSFPVLTVPGCAEYTSSKALNVMYATDFYESDNTSLDTLLKILSPFDTNIHCIHINIENDPIIKAKVDELNEFLNKEYNEYSIQCKMFESSDVIKGFEDFILKNDIDIISFSSPRRTLFYKILHPNMLKKMVLTSRIPMLVFPI